MREGELRGRRKLVRIEPADLHEIVTGPGIAAGLRRPREAEDDPSVVWLEPEPEEVDWLDLERGLLTDLAPQSVERMLVLVEKATGQIPKTLSGIDGSPAQQHPPLLVEADGLCAWNGVGIADVATRAALGTVFDLVDSLAADRTEPPAVEGTHWRDHARSAGGRVSPRAAGATQHELSRIGLLATLSGETLARLAQNMVREDIPAGAGVVTEGESGDRFYVVLSGMLSVSQRSRGTQNVLRPGDYFGEVALAMNMPRTASVRALTPVTVASCDRETFDQYVRPLFADEQ